MNKSKINKMINDIEKYLEDLDSHTPVSEKMLKNDKDKKYAISFLIEQISNEIINLGNHIVSSYNLEIPGSSKDVVDILYKNKFITEKICEKLKDLISVRNIIAHRYTKISLEQVADVTDNIDFVNEFIQQIVKKLEKK